MHPQVPRQIPLRPPTRTNPLTRFGRRARAGMTHSASICAILQRRRRKRSSSCDRCGAALCTGRCPFYGILYLRPCYIRSHASVNYLVRILLHDRSFLKYVLFFSPPFCTLLFSAVIRKLHAVPCLKHSMPYVKSDV